MEPSLSVLLPVENAESTLASEVIEILEILPELTARFELVIIDDGSQDATIEVADELAARYPQVSVVLHTRPLGRPAAIRSGLDRSRGDVIFVRDEQCGLVLAEIHKLWDAAQQHEFVLGRADPRHWLDFVGWRRGKNEGGLRMIHRQAIQRLQDTLGDGAATSDERLCEACQWHEVEMPQHPSRRPARLGSARAHHVPNGRPRAPSRPDQSKGRPRRPNYLSKIKDFALGE